MANKRIQGITIKLDGDTKPLGKSLKDVEKKSTGLQKELREVDQLLKFNPNNVVALTQKQELLEDQIGAVAEKLGTLKNAQSEVNEQFEKGEIDADQYRAFQREIEKTEDYLKNLEDKLSDVASEQEDYGTNTQRLTKLLEATGTEIDDYADVLGDKLVKAIKDGKASSQDLDRAFDKVGQSALGAGTDVDKLKVDIDSVDDGSALTNLKTDFQEVGNEVEDVTKETGEFVDTLDGLIGAMGAGMGIGEAVDKALDLSSLNTTIDVAFNVPEESKQSIKNAIYDVQTYGVDAEEAIEGVRRQWALNSDATDEANAKIVENVGVITRAFSGVDFTELIQEVNEIASELEITDEHATALVNSLLKAGFPPEEIDVIAEYGGQLQRAGYDAEEIQAIFKAGVDTGTWNIDNLLDGLKEGRIRMAEFGLEIDESTATLLENTEISTEQLQEWGQAISKGGEDGKDAMQEVALALSEIEDETIKNQLGVTIFGTMWEDQGDNIVNTILGMDEHLQTTTETQGELNDTVESINSDPMVVMQGAISDIQGALEPLLTYVSDFIVLIAEWATENPELASTIVLVTTVLGILTGVILAVGGAMAILSGASWGVIAVIAVIALAIAGAIWLFKNWDTVVEVFRDTWQRWGETLKRVWETVSTTVSTWADAMWTKIEEIWDNIVTKTTELKDGIITAFTDLKDGVSQIFTDIKDSITGIWDTITSYIKVPKITMEGEFSLNPPSMPKFGISWNAKGGIMTMPTAFGMSGNTILAGGEAGPEAILPLTDEVLGKIGAGIVKATEASNSNMEYYLYRMTTILDSIDSKDFELVVNAMTLAKLMKEPLDDLTLREKSQKDKLRGVRSWSSSV